MVKKVLKQVKAASLAPSSSVSKTKKGEKLRNGYKNNEAEKPVNETNDASKEMDSAQDNQNDRIAEVKENLTDNEKRELNMKNTSEDDVKIVPRTPRKRKTPLTEEKEKGSSKITKAKKQKVLLEIPEITPISGKVFVVGENDVGQLGLPENIDVKEKPALLDLEYSVVDIAAGGMHSVCLTEGGEVITFGCNDEGALGRITSEEGSENIPRKVEIPERIVKISAGDSHAAALSESGQVYVWGNFRNSVGPMGLTEKDTKVFAPVKVLENVKIVKISSGSDHLVCLSQEGVVYTCGCGESGQLGRVSERVCSDGGRKGMALLLRPEKVPVTKSNKSSSAKNIWTGHYSTFVKIENGSIYAFGLNNYDQLGLETPQNLENEADSSQFVIWKPTQVESFNNKPWLQINGGQHHTIALDDNGLVYSLGRSVYGRLGLKGMADSDTKVSVPTAIPSLKDEVCVDISSGNCSSFAVTETGSVFSWGMGSTYQLGHGSESDQHLPKLIEGNFLNSWKAIKIAGGGQHTLILVQPRKILSQ